jgi:hypothetical protein
VSYTGVLLPENEGLNIGIGDKWTGEASYPYMSGKIDEIRFSNIPRSNAWLKTEYNMMGTPAGFMRVGDEQQASGGAQYGSPLDAHGVTDQWVWSNFTWQNPVVPDGTLVGWRVYFFDSSGNTMMTDSMSFRVSSMSNLPPSTPSNPAPAVDAVDVSPFVSLGWDACSDPYGDPVTYDVYFGATNPPSLISANQTTPSYSPGAMDTDTMYYWRVVAWDNHGASTPGQLWHFTTANVANGDANSDGKIDVGDIVYLINYLFKSGSAPNPLEAGDANLNGKVDVGDVVYLVNYLFKNGPAPSG